MAIFVSLTWSHIGDDWEVKTGVGKVFWGQGPKSPHFSDIIKIKLMPSKAIDGEGPNWVSLWWLLSTV